MSDPCSRPHDVSPESSRGSRFVLVVDRDGVSISLPGGKRLAVWIGDARRRFGRFEVFAPREGWL